MIEPFIARERECSELRRSLDSNKSEFVIVYGRRRIGKTYLIENFFNGIFDFRFVGTRDADMRTQLTNFTNELNRFSGSKHKRYESWTEAFYALREYLEKLPNDRKKIIFFDEMPWIDSRRSDFVRCLEYFWNSWAINKRNILFIATGSASSWMLDKLIANKGGLHGRITSRIHVKPFTLREVEEYLSKNGSPWDRFQILQSYMLLGGVPFYYSLLDFKASLAQNIDNLFFREDGELCLEFNELYYALFKNADIYISTVKLLCEHKSGLTNKELSKKLQVDTGKLTKVLRNLERCDFIERWNQYGNKKRQTQYRMKDFFTIFYYKFVESNNFKDERWWSNNLNSKVVSTWMGNTFELVCMIHSNQIKYSLHIDTIGTSISTWRHITKNQNESGAQIDMLIERADRYLHLCEIKFSREKFEITKEYEETLDKRAGIFRAVTGTDLSLVHTFITTKGVLDGKHKSIVHSEVTMDDLFNS